MGVRHRLTRLAIRPHLTGRTIRLRLTLLYGGLFLASGIALLVITYALMAQRITGPLSVSSGQVTTPTPPPGASTVTVTARDASPSAIVVHRPGGPDRTLQDQYRADLQNLLVQSSIAIGIMAAVSIALGWFMAGRVLRPLRTMTATTRQISENNLHERLAVRGPPDELRDLGDTINELLSRLEAAFEAQRRFVANASHELRTPLTLGRAMLQVALANPAITLDSLRATCEEVLQTGSEQEHLIEALLTLARSQRGIDHRDPIDLATVAADVLRSQEPTANARGVTIDAALHPAPAAGDTRLVQRLVSNLVENGLRHNRPNGRLTIATGTRDGQAVLRVGNTGPPVPPDQIGRLLQPFQRLDTAHRDAQRVGEHDGLGLGLSIVAAIATAHGATLDLRAGISGGLVIDVSFPNSATGESSRRGKDNKTTVAGRHALGAPSWKTR